MCWLLQSDNISVLRKLVQRSVQADTWYPGSVRTASTTARAARCCRKGILLPSLELSSTWTPSVNMAQPRGLSQAFLPRPTAAVANTGNTYVVLNTYDFLLTKKMNKNQCNWNLSVFTHLRYVWILCLKVYSTLEHWPLPCICRAATAISPTSFGTCRVNLKRKKNYEHRWHPGHPLCLKLLLNLVFILVSFYKFI